MNYLWIALIVVAILLVLYLVARRVHPFGQSIAFVCTVFSRVNVTIAEYLTQAANYCTTVRLASLHYPPGVGEPDYWPGVTVCSRLVYFVLAVCILTGETINTLLVLPALFQTANHVVLPGIVDIASAALFICCPALWGAVLLESVGLIPHSAGLFPPMKTVTRWGVGVLSAVFLVASILLQGYFYLYRAAYLLDPQSAQAMSLIILGGLGLLIAAVSVLALWALVVGGAGVVSLFMWLTERTCRMVAAFAAILPSLLDVLAVHLSQGTMSVHGTYHGHAPYTVPANPFALSGGVLPVNAVLPIQTPETEKDMNNPEKNASIVFIGSYGSRMCSPFAQKIATLRATESIRTSGYLDLAISHLHTAIPGIADISPTIADRKTAAMHGETDGKTYATLLCHMGDRLVEEHQDTTASPAPFLFVIDCRLLVYAFDMLASIKRRLPLHALVVVTSLSAFDAKDASVQEGFAAMQRLVAEDCIETVLVTDPRSPFAMKYGENTQLHFLAHALVSLVIAQKHSLNNRSGTDVLRQLHGLSPFTTISFASEAVAVGNIPTRWAWLPGIQGHVGVGNLSDILMQTRAAIQRVLIEENTRAFPAEVNTDASCIVLCTSPYELNNRRFHECVGDNALYVGTHYPFASSLTIRGNGCVYPYHMGSKYLVTASCLYPLHPAILPKLPEGTHGQVTSLLPVAKMLEPTNGQAQSEPQNQHRQQTPASPRRSGRKAKQAGQ